MPIQIHVTTSSGVEKHPLNTATVRLGSNPNLEVVVPELPPQALTIRTQAGVLAVYNRCSETILVGRTKLQKGQSCDWAKSSQIKIGDVSIKWSKPSKKTVQTNVKSTSNPRRPIPSREPTARETNVANEATPLKPVSESKTENLGTVESGTGFTTRKWICICVAIVLAFFLLMPTESSQALATDLLKQLSTDHAHQDSPEFRTLLHNLQMYGSQETVNQPWPTNKEIRMLNLTEKQQAAFSKIYSSASRDAIASR